MFESALCLLFSGFENKSFQAMLFISNRFCILLASTLIIGVMATEEHKERRVMGGWTEQDVNSDSIKVIFAYSLNN
jgi:hypothetical protein